MFEKAWKIVLTVGAMLVGGVASAHEVTVANHALAGVGNHYVNTLGAGNVHYTAGTFGAGNPCNPQVSAFTFSYPQVQYVPAPASFLPQVAAPVPVTVAVPATGVTDGDYADEVINDPTTIVGPGTVAPVPVPQPVYGPGFSGNAGLGVGTGYGSGLGYLNGLGINRFGLGNGNGLNYLNRLNGLGHGLNGVGHNGLNGLGHNGVNRGTGHNGVNRGTGHNGVTRGTGHNGVNRGVGNNGGVRRGPVARAAKGVARGAKGVARAGNRVNRPVRTNNVKVGGHTVARTTVHRR